MSSTPLLPHTPLNFLGTGRRLGPRLRPAVATWNILVAAAVFAVIVLAGTITPATGPDIAIALTSADPIPIDRGVSITPAPDWSLLDRGPNWVVLGDDNAGARMRVTVKPAGGTDVAAVLQDDVNAVLADTSLTNLTTLGGPKTKDVQGSTFQRAARMDYTADDIQGVATTHLLGVFMELLNTSNGLSAFIDYRESSDAPSQIGGNAEAMINSML